MATLEEEVAVYLAEWSKPTKWTTVDVGYQVYPPPRSEIELRFTTEVVLKCRHKSDLFSHEKCSIIRESLRDAFEDLHEPRYLVGVRQVAVDAFLLSFQQSMRLYFAARKDRAAIAASKIYRTLRDSGKLLWKAAKLVALQLQQQFDAKYGRLEFRPREVVGTPEEVEYFASQISGQGAGARLGHRTVLSRVRANQALLAAAELRLFHLYPRRTAVELVLCEAFRAALEGRQIYACLSEPYTHLGTLLALEVSSVVDPELGDLDEDASRWAMEESLLPAEEVITPEFRSYHVPADKGYTQRILATIFTSEEVAAIRPRRRSPRP